jgi:hypothetical protein
MTEAFPEWIVEVTTRGHDEAEHQESYSVRAAGERDAIEFALAIAQSTDGRSEGELERCGVSLSARVKVRPEHLPGELVVVEMIVYRCGHSRKFKCCRLVGGPPHVLCHLGTDNCYPHDENDLTNAAFELLAQLAEHGYRVQTSTTYEDVSLVEFVDIIGGT